MSTYHALSGPEASERPRPSEDGRQEAAEADRGDDQQARQQVQGGPGDEDGPAAEHVRQPAGRQLERHDGQAVHGEQHADLAQGQSPGLRQQHGDRSGQPQRQPAQGGQPDQALGGGPHGERCARRPVPQRNKVEQDADGLGALARLVGGMRLPPAVSTALSSAARCRVCSGVRRSAWSLIEAAVAQAGSRRSRWASQADRTRARPASCRRIISSWTSAPSSCCNRSSARQLVMP